MTRNTKPVKHFITKKLDRKKTGGLTAVLAKYVATSPTEGGEVQIEPQNGMAPITTFGGSDNGKSEAQRLADILNRAWDDFYAGQGLPPDGGPYTGNLSGDFPTCEGMVVGNKTAEEILAEEGTCFDNED